MATNKVVFGAVTIMDITDSTVTKETLAEGVTAYDKTGEKITGTMKQAVDPKLQEKTVTPTTSQQAVTPDSSYDGLSKVTVNAMPTATQATPSISVSSAGLITASATQSAGYVVSGTKKATKQLTVQSAKTITPSKSTQTAVASGRYTTGAVTVAPIPDTYIQPSGTKTITENGTHDVKSYASVNVNVDAEEDLDTELTSIEAKIAQLNAILSGQGYTVTIRGAYQEDFGSAVAYSLDNGATWTEVTDSPLVIDNAAQIMLKAINPGSYAGFSEAFYYTDSEYEENYNEDTDITEWAKTFSFNTNYTLTDNTTFDVSVDW